MEYAYREFAQDHLMTQMLPGSALLVEDQAVVDEALQEKLDSKRLIETDGNNAKWKNTLLASQVRRLGASADIQAQRSQKRTSVSANRFISDLDQDADKMMRISSDDTLRIASLLTHGLILDFRPYLPSSSAVTYPWYHGTLRPYSPQTLPHTRGKLVTSAT